MIHPRAAALALGLLAGVPGLCAAAVFCVGDGDALTAALVQAENNAEHDEVRIRAGVYATAKGWRIDLANGALGINLAGGFLDEDCLLHSPDARLTIFDGLHQARPLLIETSTNFGQSQSSEIVIRGLTFRNGSGDVGAGLKISDSGPIYGGTVLVEGNIFEHNAGTELRVGLASEGAGALYVATDGPSFEGGLGMAIRNNIFHGNSAPDGAAAFLFSNNDIAVANNTFVANRSHDATLARRLAVGVFSLASVILHNNIFWQNAAEDDGDAFDLHALAGQQGDMHATELHGNLIQRLSGTARVDVDTLNIDPGFVGPSDLALSASSPLRDIGCEGSPGGHGSNDAHGNARRSNGRIDIGALEFQPQDMLLIYANGFE